MITTQLGRRIKRLESSKGFQWPGIIKCLQTIGSTSRGLPSEPISEEDESKIDEAFLQLSPEEISILAQIIEDAEGSK